MEEEVHMRVDEAGEQRGVAEIDDLSALGMVDGSGDGADAVAFNEDLARLQERAGVDLEQAGGVEDDGRVRRLLGGGCECQSCGAEGERCRLEGREKARTEIRHDSRICRSCAALSTVDLRGHFLKRFRLSFGLNHSGWRVKAGSLEQFSESASAPRAWRVSKSAGAVAR